MQYTFANGSARQKSLWELASTFLLNLPADAIPLHITVEFRPPSSLNKQTTLAQTEFDYDSSDSLTEVRNDAPGFGSIDDSLIAEAGGWGLTWTQVNFYYETAVHELGHSAFAAIPHEYRVKIAQMFGAKSDELAELTQGKLWQSHITEAIAETFKEAFLPRSKRVFPNRTTHHIQYALYPTFRRYFREGLASVKGGPTVFPTKKREWNRRQKETDAVEGEGFTWPAEEGPSQSGVEDPEWSEGPDTDEKVSRTKAVIPVSERADWRKVIRHARKVDDTVFLSLLAPYSINFAQAEIAYQRFYSLHYALTGTYLEPGYSYPMRVRVKVTALWEDEDGNEFTDDTHSIYDFVKHFILNTGETDWGEPGASWPLQSNWVEVESENEEQEHWATTRHIFHFQVPSQAVDLVGFRVETYEYTQTLSGTAVSGPEEGEFITEPLSRSLGVLIGSEPSISTKIAKTEVLGYTEEGEAGLPIAVPAGAIAGGGGAAGSKPHDRPTRGNVA